MAEKDDPTEDAPKPSGDRELVSLHGADDLKTPEQREVFAQGFAQEVVKAVQQWRKAKGLPPLPKE